MKFSFDVFMIGVINVVLIVNADEVSDLNDNDKFSDQQFSIRVMDRCSFVDRVHFRLYVTENALLRTVEAAARGTNAIARLKTRHGSRR